MVHPYDQLGHQHAAQAPLAMHSTRSACSRLHPPQGTDAHPAPARSRGRHVLSRLAIKPSVGQVGRRAVDDAPCAPAYMSSSSTYTPNANGRCGSAASMCVKTMRSSSASPSACGSKKGHVCERRVRPQHDERRRALLIKRLELAHCACCVLASIAMCC